MLFAAAASAHVHASLALFADHSVQIDPIVTGPTSVDGFAGPRFTQADFDRCDADCQAKAAGISFN